MKKKIKKLDQKIKKYLESKIAPYTEAFEKKAHAVFKKNFFPIIEKGVNHWNKVSETYLIPFFQKASNFLVRLFVKILKFSFWTILALGIAFIGLTFYLYYCEIEGQKQNKVVYEQVAPMISRANDYFAENKIDSFLIVLDSMISITSEKSDSLHAKFLAEKAEHLIGEGDYAAAEEFADLAIDAQDKTLPYQKNYHAYRKARMVSAEIFGRKRKVLIAAVHQDLIEKAVENKDTIGFFESMTAMLRVLGEEREYERFIKIMEEFENIEDAKNFDPDLESIPEDVAFAFNQETVFFIKDLLEIEEVAEMQKSTLSYFDSDYIKAKVLFNVGSIYEIAEMPDSAYYYHKKSLNLSKKFDSEVELQKHYKHLAICATLLKDYDDALNLADTFHILATNAGDKSDILSSKVIKTDALLKKKKFNEAKKVFGETDFSNINVKDTVEYIRFLRVDAEIKKLTGRYEMAFDSLNKANDVEKAHLRNELSRNKESLAVFFDEVMDRVEILGKARTDEKAFKESNRTNWLIAFGFFVIFLLIIWGLYSSYRAVEEENKELNPIKEVKDSPEFQVTGNITLKKGITIEFSDLIMIEKVKNTDRVMFFTESRGEIEEYTTLEKLINEGNLPYPLFMRTHQSFIINVLKVHECLKSDKVITLKGGLKARVSKSKSKEVFSYLSS